MNQDQAALLQKTQELTQRTHDAVIEMRTSCKSCRKTVADHETAIGGNGRDGLKTEVAVLKTRVNELGRYAKGVWTLFLSVVTLAGKALWDLLKS